MSVSEAMRLRAVVELAMAPGGEEIAYVTDRADSALDRHVRTLSVLSIRDDRTRVVAAGTPVSRPQWSPSGLALAYLAPSGRHQQIWIERSGRPPRAVSAQPGGVVEFAWAPDARRIAFIADEPENRELPAGARQFPQASRFRDLWLLDTGTGKVSRATNARVVFDDISWSPDGRLLAVSYRPEATTEAFVTGTDIAIVRPADGSLRPLVTRPGMDAMPRWSPDGRTIAFLSHGGVDDWIGDTYVCLAHPDEPERPFRNLTPTIQERILADESILEWDGDGLSLFFAVPDRQSSRLWRIPADSAAPALIAAPAGVSNGFSFTADRRAVAFAAATPSSAWELYVASVHDFTPRRLTNSNPWLDSVALGEMQEVSWPAHDGTRIEGLLLSPPNARHPAPLILYLHGGPAWSFVQALTPQGWLPKSGQSELYPLHALAGAGIAVLLPNPRGSLGRGREFRLANVEDWGGRDAGDVLAGVDSLIAAGVADPRRLGVMGFSYGGILAAQLIARTDRFQAAQIGAGAIDPSALFGETDIPLYVMRYFGGAP